MQGLQNNEKRHKGKQYGEVPISYLVFQNLNRWKKTILKVYLFKFKYSFDGFFNMYLSTVVRKRSKFV